MNAVASTDALHPEASAAVADLEQSLRKRRSLTRRITLLMLLPSTLWFLLLLVMPLVIILVFSFGERSAVGGYAGGLTLANYMNLGSRAAAFGNTLMLAPLGTLVCLLAAYPLAYFLAVKAGKNRSLLLTLVIVPFWTSFLIRTYAWIFILSGKGIPALLASIGLEDVRLINTPYAVLIGIVYGYLPLMVFPIYVSLEKLDKRLLEASSDQRAGKLSAHYLAVVGAWDHHRRDAGVHSVDGRIPDPGGAGWRQGVLRR